MPRDVSLGDLGTLHVGSFRAFKAVHVGALISNASTKAEAVWEAYEAFKRDYRAANRQRVPEEVVTIQNWNVADSAWKVDDTGQRYIEIPQVPDDNQVILHIFEQAFTTARTEVTRLLGLIVIPNSELETAEAEGDQAVQNVLDNKGREVLRKATTGEIIRLLAATVDAVRDELEQQKAELGKLQSLWRRTRSSAPPDEADETQGETTSPDSTTPPDDSSDSSTPSAPPTEAGPGATSSGELATSSS
jgi:hypothetical protein